jgi:hypothetical protein
MRSDSSTIGHLARTELSRSTAQSSTNGVLSRLAAG